MAQVEPAPGAMERPSDMFGLQAPLLARPSGQAATIETLPRPPGRAALSLICFGNYTFGNYRDEGRRGATSRTSGGRLSSWDSLCLVRPLCQLRIGHQHLFGSSFNPTIPIFLRLAIEKVIVRSGAPAMSNEPLTPHSSAVIVAPSCQVGD